jgi:hypothetical protein
MTTTSVYCMDTSAIIDWHERFYPPESFPSLVPLVDDLIAAGRLLLSEEVALELRAKAAAAGAWCDSRKEQLVLPTDAGVAVAVRDILREHPRLVGALKNRNRADPFVIAVARLKGAVVVTGEVGGSANRPKIPYVCGQLGIGCLGFVDLIKAEGWRL